MCLKIGIEKSYGFAVKNFLEDSPILFVRRVFCLKLSSDPFLVILVKLLTMVFYLCIAAETGSLMAYEYAEMRAI